MILTGGPFWFSMGVVFVLVASAFRVFAEDRGWVVTWWKGLLALVWYAVVSLSFFAWGTLIGEGEGEAGFKLLLIGLFVAVVLGVALIRVFAHRPRSCR